MKIFSSVFLMFLSLTACAKKEDAPAMESNQTPVASAPVPSALPATMDPRSANPMLDKARAAAAGAEAQQQASQAELDQVR